MLRKMEECFIRPQLELTIIMHLLLLPSLGTTSSMMARQLFLALVCVLLASHLSKAQITNARLPACTGIFDFYFLLDR